MSGKSRYAAEVLADSRRCAGEIRSTDDHERNRVNPRTLLRRFGLLTGIGILAALPLSPAGALPAPSAAAPRATAPTLVTGSEGRQSIARCPAGTTVMGGGYQATRFARSNGGSVYDYVTANGPVAADNSWRAGVLRDTSTVLAYALCAPNDQGYRIATGNSAHQSDATCPTGTRVVGGGYGIQSFARANGGTIYDYATANGPVATDNSWRARMHQGNSRITATAVCAPESMGHRIATGPSAGQSDATCPTGTRVIGGGYGIQTFVHARGGTLYDSLTANGPVATDNSWRARMLHDSGRVIALAVCAPEGLGYRIATGPSARDSQAACPAGTRVAGGGYGVQRFVRANGGEIYDYPVVNGPTPGATAWRAHMLHDSGRVIALAVCAPTG
ncbi:hypothetical protein DDQ41_19430 [Streptomyces spongiicola]|uniref:Uncharacterized protein n=1 Tax=Streptomyces spongiicola TaxID=1690221 RepID=A0ABM6V9E1_9ACTN|nr:hypothetical protein [Streptomyces spongiicola]AWK10713.1 hypothetical protein DDQ41_19430 [Streptomyces spongiicola]